MSVFEFGTRIDYISSAMVNVLQRMEQLTNELFRDVFNSDILYNYEFVRKQNVIKPSYEVYDANDSYKVFVYLPGVKREEINIVQHDGVLSISAKRSVPEGELIRAYGCYSDVSEYRLDLNVRTESVEAKFENGVLVLSVSKTPNGKVIQVQ